MVPGVKDRQGSSRDQGGEGGRGVRARSRDLVGHGREFCSWP